MSWYSDMKYANCEEEVNCCKAMAYRECVEDMDAMICDEIEDMEEEYEDYE